MSSALETAIQSVKTAIDDAQLKRGDNTVITVQDFDPLPGDLDTPAVIAVTFGGMSPTDYYVIVRLYTNGTGNIQAAELFTRYTTPALDAALDTVPAPRTPWQKTWSPDLLCYVVETALGVPRDDF